MSVLFKGYKNVQCLALDAENMDFTAFNEKVLTAFDLPMVIQVDRLPSEKQPASEDVDLDSLWTDIGAITCGE